MNLRIKAEPQRDETNEKQMELHSISDLGTDDHHVNITNILSIKTTTKPFKCNVCDRAFKRRANLKIHQVHTDIICIFIV